MDELLTSDTYALPILQWLKDNLSSLQLVRNARRGLRKGRTFPPCCDVRMRLGGLFDRVATGLIRILRLCVRVCVAGSPLAMTPAGTPARFSFPDPFNRKLLSTMSRDNMMYNTSSGMSPSPHPFKT